MIAKFIHLSRYYFKMQVPTFYLTRTEMQSWQTLAFQSEYKLWKLKARETQILLEQLIGWLQRSLWEINTVSELTSGELLSRNKLLNSKHNIVLKNCISFKNNKKMIYN